MHHFLSSRRLWPSVILLCACTAREPYLVADAEVVSVTRLPVAQRQGLVVPARRQRDGHPVWVRAESLRLGLVPAAPPSGQAAPLGLVRVEAERRSRLAVAGAVLTLGGCALSVAGSLLFFAARGEVHTDGGILAAVAEPPMWVGSALWIVGLARHPSEMPPPRNL